MRRESAMEIRWTPLIVVGLVLLQMSCAGIKRRKASFPLPQRQGGPTSYSTTPVPDVDDENQGVLHVRDIDGEWKSLYWVKQSQSIGPPNDGALQNGSRLPQMGPGWVRKGDNAYGTDETIRLLSWCLTGISRRYPDGAPVVIGDISQQGGGRFKRHNSHQSGRDVDIGFYHIDNVGLRGFSILDREALDAEKTWFLLEQLIRTGQVRFIFINYKIQEQLFAEAIALGWSEGDLRTIFQYPRGHRARKGLIRHAKGHRDHFHVRFKCPDRDTLCVP